MTGPCDASGPALVWSIGHSNRTWEAFEAIVRAHGVRAIVDVRAFPRSRRHPHFNAPTLARGLASAGIAYRHVPDLGGMRKAEPGSANLGLPDDGFRGFADHMQTKEFARGLADLLACAARARTACMCAEGDPNRCHRSLIADALVARGVEVRHLLGGKQRPHAVSAYARVEDGRVTYPGLV